MTESAERVMELEDVSACYGDTAIFEKLSLLIRRQESVVLELTGE